MEGGDKHQALEVPLPCRPACPQRLPLSHERVWLSLLPLGLDSARSG